MKIRGYEFFVNLMFSQGTEIPDPEGLLTGTGKRARHVRIDRVEDVSRPGVQILLKTAADLLDQRG